VWREQLKAILAEALARWEHPTWGLIPPDDFIPIAEETGLIIDIGKWVLDEVCRNYKQWLDLGLSPIKVSINLSAIEFYGEEIVSNIKKLKTAIPLIRHHHEHYDGNGYPSGLMGDQIPLGARILSVVDAYGAMIDRRVYRPPRNPEDAVTELQKKSGLQFDPRVVNAFISFQSA